MALQDFPKDHPIWDLLKIVVVTACSVAGFGIGMWIFASSFDDTEIKAMLTGGTLTASLGGAGVAIVRTLWKT